ncbi:response regulator transcription factor [Paenibacillus cymbidii]|uniref:response regulator transcription factor n=1 Tax=Paenibacillus cymbidii TaxID=1639034 RepID=UPI001F173F19|nr:response regulator [Paenibacillus cymbidii]
MMIVDDEPMAREYIRLNFPWSQWGVEIVGEAINGVEALELCRNFRPDLMLIDITMPLMDGLELLEKLKAQNPDIQCIILTAHRNFDYAQKAIQKGACGYMLKSPIETVETKLVIDRAIQEIVKLSAQHRTIRHQQYILDHYRYPLRKKFLENIVNGLIRDQDVVEKANSLGMIVRNSAYYMLKCVVDRQSSYLKRYPEADYPLVDFTFMEIIRETLALYAPRTAELMSNTFGTCVILLPAQQEGQQPDGPEAAHTLAAEVLKHCNQALAKLMQITVSVVVGEQPVPPGQFRAKYKQLTAVADHLYYAKDTSLVIAEKTAPFQSLPSARYQELGDQLAGVLADRNSVTLDKWLDRVQQLSLTHKPDPDPLRDWFDSLKHAFGKGETGHNEARPLLDDWPSFKQSDNIYVTLFAIKERILKEWTISDSQVKVRPEIAKAAAYIRAHLHEELSLHVIANQVQLSPNYLGKMFRAEMGSSITDFIMEERIQAAKRLMREGILRNYEISEKVGFNNYSYFCTMFKKMAEQSPNEYRNSLKASVQPD